MAGWSKLSHEEQKKRLDEAIRRKLRAPLSTMAASARVATRRRIVEAPPAVEQGDARPTA
jgi:hypothetical protein